MFISLIFFYSTIELIFSINSVNSSCNRTPTVTELHRFTNHVLKRRIRSVVFPNKAQLLLTPAFTKAVLDGRPRGLSYSVEFDMYSPLPDTIEGWKPTILYNKLNDGVTATENFKINSPHTTRDFKDHEQNFNNLTENAVEPDFLYEYYNYPFHEAKSPNTVNLEWEQRTINPTNRNFKIESNKLYGFATNFHQVPYYRKKFKRNKNFSSTWGKKFATEEPHFGTDYAYRFQREHEREQIIKQFEIVGRVFKINVKKCIHRALCELNSHLRSQGESVMLDIIRIILIPSYRLNVPIDRGSSSSIQCKRKYAVSCPYSFLYNTKL